jgi:hypothetical protein
LSTCGAGLLRYAILFCVLNVAIQRLLSSSAFCIQIAIQRLLSSSAFCIKNNCLLFFIHFHFLSSRMQATTEQTIKLNVCNPMTRHQARARFPKHPEPIALLRMFFLLLHGLAACSYYRLVCFYFHSVRHPAKVGESAGISSRTSLFFTSLLSRLFIVYNSKRSNAHGIRQSQDACE